MLQVPCAALPLHFALLTSQAGTDCTCLTWQLAKPQKTDFLS